MVNKVIASAALLATIVAGTLATSSSAEAHRWHHHHWRWNHPHYMMWGCHWKYRWHHHHLVKWRVCY